MSGAQGLPGLGSVVVMAFLDYQNEIYLHGLAGNTPALPKTPAALEAAAVAAMTPQAVGYVVGSAGDESTHHANRAGFERHRIVPRMMRGVVERDLSTTVLGTAMPAPVLLAPVGVLEIVHPDAELAVARAAKRTGVPMVLSTASSYTIEQVAEHLDGSPGWYQLYYPRNRELAASFVRRAEAAGYTAIVLTLDTWSLGWRPRDLEQAYLPFLQSKGIANYLTDPVFRGLLAKSPEDDPQMAVLTFLGLFGDPAMSWDDLEFLRAQTTLPIVVKGVLHPDDAARGVDLGADAVLVSNHGGRQVAGSVAAVDALPAVVAAVGEQVPVLLDSGVRTGADVVKALALGADAVLLGRPYVYGLALAGEDGVVEVVRSLLADTEQTLALAGHASPATLTRDVLVEP